MYVHVRPAAASRELCEAKKISVEGDFDITHGFLASLLK
jgi:hypothetical protein